ncbi:MAG: PPC domain-containing protein [Anaerolineae bacterium]
MRSQVLLLSFTLLVGNLFYLAVPASSTALAETQPELMTNLAGIGIPHYYIGADGVDLSNPTSDGSDDSFEENDTSDTAKMLPPGLYGRLTCLDDDWYQIQLDKKAMLTVAVAFGHADGNIDLQLFLSDGSTRIAESTSTTDDEYIRIPDLYAGNYLLRIYAPQNQSNDYGLAIVLNGDSLVQIEDTDNDWYLPPGVKRDPDSGFFRFGLSNPSPELPVLSGGDNQWSWKTLNPAEGVYRFDLIQKKIDELQGTPYVLGMRIHCSEREKVPDWVIQKYNPPIVTFTGGKYEIEYVSPWHPDVEAEFLKFVIALGQTGIPQNPRVVFAYIHGISSSRGEELGLKSVDKTKAEQYFGLTPEVYRNWAIKRIDAWADAFSGVEYKLMWVGKEDSLGYSQRPIMIEFTLSQPVRAWFTIPMVKQVLIMKLTFIQISISRALLNVEPEATKTKHIGAVRGEIHWSRVSAVG